MKKKLAVVAASIMTMGILTGCEETVIKYNDDYYPVEEVEEIVEDILEEQNPESDYEVSILEEYED